MATNNSWNTYREFYKEEAKIYDSTRYRSTYGRLFEKIHHETIMDLLTCEQNKTILDVAGGTGHSTLLLSQKGHNVFSVDLTSEMLEKAKMKQDELSGFPKFAIGNAFTLPYRSQSFDVVISTRFLHLWTKNDQMKLIAEMHRVLKKDGLIIVDFDNVVHEAIFRIPVLILKLMTRRRVIYNSHFNTLKSADSLLKNNNFRVLENRGIGSGFLIPFCYHFKSLSGTLGHLLSISPLKLFCEQFLFLGQKTE